MPDAFNTTKAATRRELHFTCLDDIRADVDKLAQAKELRHLGNWSPGQVLRHLAMTMDNSIDGFPFRMPGILRFILRLTMKQRLLTKPMGAGFNLPKRAAAMLPQPTSWEEGLAGFRHALGRLKTETLRSPSPVIGPLTADEWEQLHCRHSELHLSFLLPS